MQRWRGSGQSFGAQPEWASPSWPVQGMCTWMCTPAQGCVQSMVWRLLCPPEGQVALAGEVGRAQSLSTKLEPGRSRSRPEQELLIAVLPPPDI